MTKVSKKSNKNVGKPRAFLRLVNIAGTAVVVLVMVLVQTNIFSAFEAHVVNVTAEPERRCVQWEVRSMGFWKNHPELRIFPQTVGDIVVSNHAEADAVFDNYSFSARNKLRGQLLALMFNIPYFDIGGVLVPNEAITVSELAAEAAALLLKNNPLATDSELLAMKDRVEAVNIIELLIRCEHPLFLVNKVYYDVESTPSKTNLLVNPGFEAGTDPWVRYTTGVGSFTTVTPGYDSPAAAEINIVNEGMVEMYQSGLTLEAGATYRLTFSAKSNTGHDLKVYVGQQSSGQNYGLNGYLPDITSDWQTLTIQFIATGFSGTVNDAKLRFYTAPYDYHGDIYWFDNIALEKVLPTDRGEEPDNEWVEILSKTEIPYDISGWQICDANACDVIPAGTPPIPAFGYAVVTADASTWDYWMIPPEVVKIVLPGSAIGNGLSNSADMVYLERPDGKIVDQMNYGAPNNAWPNYNADVWDPGVPDAPAGHMLARSPSGFDTNKPSDWISLLPPDLVMIYPDLSTAVWNWGQNINITWIATNPNGPDNDLKIDVYYIEDHNQNHHLDFEDDYVVQIADQMANTGLVNFTVPYGFLGDVWIVIVATGPENIMAQATVVSRPIYDPSPELIEQDPASVLEYIGRLPLLCRDPHRLLASLRQADQLIADGARDLAVNRSLDGVSDLKKALGIEAIEELTLDQLITICDGQTLDVVIEESEIATDQEAEVTTAEEVTEEVIVENELVDELLELSDEEIIIDQELGTEEEVVADEPETTVEELSEEELSNEADTTITTEETIESEELETTDFTEAGSEEGAETESVETSNEGEELSSQEEVTSEVEIDTTPGVITLEEIAETVEPSELDQPVIEDPVEEPLLEEVPTAPADTNRALNQEQSEVSGAEPEEIVVAAPPAPEPEPEPMSDEATLEPAADLVE
ncbi:MAG: carbohydrate binding domain-containing protein [Patescibacteria group bacterium]